MGKKHASQYANFGWLLAGGFSARLRQPDDCRSNYCYTVLNYLNCDKCATISLYMTKFVIEISVLKISRIGYQSVL